MSRITIGYTDGAHYFIAYFKKVLPLIFKEFKVVFLQDPKTNPDVLIYSVFGNNYKKYLNCKKILVSGEPDSVTTRQVGQLLLDCKDVCGLRSPHISFFYLPFYVTSFWERFKNTFRELVKMPMTLEQQQQLLQQKKLFCAFLYSRTVSFRDQLFHNVSKYRPVDSLGKACAPKFVRTFDRSHYQSGVCTYNDLAVEKYLPYKFVICCENTRQKGYVTEKIVSAMLAKSIPIYLGAPDIVQHFNPKSFIHVADYDTIDQLLAEIKRLDTNPEAYLEMVDQPWFVDNKLPHYFNPYYLRPAFVKFFKDVPRIGSLSDLDADSVPLNISQKRTTTLDKHSESTSTDSQPSQVQVQEVKVEDEEKVQIDSSTTSPEMFENPSSDDITNPTMKPQSTIKIGRYTFPLLPSPSSSSSSLLSSSSQVTTTTTITSSQPTRPKGQPHIPKRHLKQVNSWNGRINK